jgi:hypothetical protein
MIKLKRGLTPLNYNFLKNNVKLSILFQQFYKFLVILKEPNKV